MVLSTDLYSVGIVITTLVVLLISTWYTVKFLVLKKKSRESSAMKIDNRDRLGLADGQDNDADDEDDSPGMYKVHATINGRLAT